MFYYVQTTNLTFVQKYLDIQEIVPPCVIANSKCHQIEYLV